MQNLSNKVNGDVLPPEEWNQVPQEIQNVITSSGQSLSSGDLSQLVRAIARYAASGEFYEASGTANGIILEPLADMIAPMNYFDGMVCRFVATASSNNATVTVNVNGLGSRNVVTEDGSSMAVNGIQAGRISELVFSLTDNNFKFLRYQAASTTLSGVTRYADNAETITGSSTTTAVTPAGLQAKLAATGGYNTFITVLTSEEELQDVDTLYLNKSSGGGITGGPWKIEAVLNIVTLSGSGDLVVRAQPSACEYLMQWRGADGNMKAHQLMSNAEFNIPEADLKEDTSLTVLITGAVSFGASNGFYLRMNTPALPDNYVLTLATHAIYTQLYQ